MHISRVCKRERTPISPPLPIEHLRLLHPSFRPPLPASHSLAFLLTSLLCAHCWGPPLRELIYINPRVCTSLSLCCALSRCIRLLPMGVGGKVRACANLLGTCRARKCARNGLRGAGARQAVASPMPQPIANQGAGEGGDKSAFVLQATSGSGRTDPTRPLVCAWSARPTPSVDIAPGQDWTTTSCAARQDAKKLKRLPNTRLQVRSEPSDSRPSLAHFSDLSPDDKGVLRQRWQAGDFERRHLMRCLHVQDRRQLLRRFPFAIIPRMCLEGQD